MSGRFNLFMLIACYHLWGVKGDDPFERSFPGPGCIPERSIRGCSGTLIENYHTKTQPMGSNEPDTAMLLFTRKNANSAEFLNKCGGRFPLNTNFDPAQKTEIFIHGGIDGVCRTAWMREMKDQLLIRGSYNVILIDWTWGNFADYVSIVSNTRVVGEQVAFLVNNTIGQTGIDSRTVHIVGHSLGCQAAGAAGRNINNLGRITGLEPAGFEQEPKYRLNRNNANLVDIMHTDAAGTCFNEYILLFIGYKGPIGHADFYVNGGSVQESCLPYALYSLFKHDDFYAFETLLIPSLCYHYQAVQYYKASINPCGCQFIGVECPNYESFEDKSCRSCGQDGSRCAVMGMDFDKYFKKRDDQDHRYYLDTSIQCPYCNNSGINLEGFQVKMCGKSSYCQKENANGMQLLSSFSL